MYEATAIPIAGGRNHRPNLRTQETQNIARPKKETGVVIPRGTTALPPCGLTAKDSQRQLKAHVQTGPIFVAMPDCRILVAASALGEVQRRPPTAHARTLYNGPRNARAGWTGLSTSSQT